MNRSAAAADTFGPGNAGAGEIGCGSGLSDIDISSTRDHDIRDVDPTCATGSPDPRGSNACVGPLTVTRSGGPGPRGSAVMRLNVAVEEFPDLGTCVIETDTGVCRGGNNPGAQCTRHPEYCIGGHCIPAKGADGIPCTDDDPPEVATSSTLTFATGTARAEVLKADNEPEVRIGVGRSCEWGSAATSGELWAPSSGTVVQNGSLNGRRSSSCVQAVRCWV